MKNVYRGISCFIITVFAAVVANAQSARTKKPTAFYKTVKMYNNKLSISIPATFTLMPQAIIDSKYPNKYKNPQIVYTNSESSVNVAFSQTDEQTEEYDLPEVKNYLTKQVQAGKFQGFVSRIEKINGHDYIVFEFISQAIDTRIYNLVFVTNLDHKLLTGTFNCTTELEKEWKPKAKEMLASLRKD